MLARLRFADSAANWLASYAAWRWSRFPPTTTDATRRNMTRDGLFHAATWAITLVGVYSLLRVLSREAS